MNIERGSVHIMCVNGATDPPTIESKTLPNATLAARWLIVQACPRRKAECKEFCGHMREFLNELESQ